MASSPSSTPILRRQGVRLIAMLALSFTLSACDYVASFTKPKQTPEEARAEGIALGAGCRQAGQSLEECYQRNPDKLKAGIFAGWKDMHEYMAAKNIQTVAPPPPEKTDAEKEKDAAAAKDKEAPKDDRAMRRERRERERAEKDKDSKSKDGGGDSSDKGSDKSSRRSRERDDSSSKK